MLVYSKILFSESHSVPSSLSPTFLCDEESSLGHSFSARAKSHKTSRTKSPS
jgi:hypothetical protein